MQILSALAKFSPRIQMSPKAWLSSFQKVPHAPFSHPQRQFLFWCFSAIHQFLWILWDHAIHGLCVWLLVEHQDFENHVTFLSHYLFVAESCSVVWTDRGVRHRMAERRSWPHWGWDDEGCAWVSSRALLCTYVYLCSLPLPVFHLLLSVWGGRRHFNSFV